uniref:DWNN domain-containing protein n=1 Tax=Cynoglossus semilaevis TaxID=244447 RepID=A0A3P8WWW5_CYNSE
MHVQICGQMLAVANSYDTLIFDGPHITLMQLKKKIMCREKLRAADCDLQITNAQSKQEYTEDESPIPKGSSVIVRRIPISGTKSSTSSKIHHIDPSLAQFHPSFVKSMDNQTPSSTLQFFAKVFSVSSYCFNSMNLTLHFLSDLLCLNVWFPQI